MWTDGIPPKYDKTSRDALSSLVRKRVRRELDLHLCSEELSPDEFGDKLKRSRIQRTVHGAGKNLNISRTAITGLLDGKTKTQFAKVDAIANYLIRKQNLPSWVFFPKLDVIELAQRQMQFFEVDRWSDKLISRYDGLIEIDRLDRPWALDLLVDYVEDFKVLLVRGRVLWKDFNGTKQIILLHGYAVPTDKKFCIFLKDGIQSDAFIVQIPRHEDERFMSTNIAPRFGSGGNYLVSEEANPLLVADEKYSFFWHEGRMKDLINFVANQDQHLVASNSANYLFPKRFKDVFNSGRLLETYLYKKDAPKFYASGMRNFERKYLL